MENRFVETALRLQQNGHNCAQAAVCAFAPLLPCEERTLFMLAEGFGSGFGGCEGTCGALSGAVMAISSLRSKGDPMQVTKRETYVLTKRLYDRFVEKAHSSVCKDLRGLESGIELHSCPDCVADAVRIAYGIMKEENLI